MKLSLDVPRSKALFSQVERLSDPQPLPEVDTNICSIREETMRDLLRRLPYRIRQKIRRCWRLRADRWMP